jgi:hypothetical protein
MAAGATGLSVGVRSYRWAARAVAAAVAALFIMWPAPARVGRATVWHIIGWLRFAPGSHKVYTWHGATLLLGNAYVAVGAMAIAGAAAYLWATRRSARSVPAQDATALIT